MTSLGGRGALTCGTRRMFHQRSHEERLFEPPEIVGDRLQSARILKLALDLLERQNLRGRRRSNSEDLSQEARPPHGRE